MPICMAIDVGTTSITALALDANTGGTLAVASGPNDACTSSASELAHGRSEWDARRMGRIACEVLRVAADGIGGRIGEVVGIGVTGQQHGVVVVGRDLGPVTPLVNWQDRRGEDLMPGADRTFTQAAAAVVGAEAQRRAGCALATGFMGVTLYWLRQNDRLPRQGTACFAPDYVASALTGEQPTCDPTNGATSGLFDLERRTWDREMVDALGLPRSLFPPVRETGDRLGLLCRSAAAATGLPAGLPVFVALGDHQASFVGSVASRDDSLFVNVGTGAQVARYITEPVIALPLETRPFPRDGFLLGLPGLSGGRSYALLHAFFQQVGRQVLHLEPADDVYGAMNHLAAAVPPGADGLRCDPCFAGTRADPARRATWSGMSTANFTPAHMVRALVEGMARSFHEAADAIQLAVARPYVRVVGAGNGLRQNRVLASAVANEFGMPLAVPAHHEEAAYGAALVAGVGAGVWRSLADASRVIRYEEGTPAPE